MAICTFAGLMGVAASFYIMNSTPDAQFSKEMRKNPFRGEMMKESIVLKEH